MTQLALWADVEPGTVNPFHCGRCGAHPDTVRFEGDLWRNEWAGTSLWRCPCGHSWQWPWRAGEESREYERRRPPCPVCDPPEPPGALPDDPFPTVHRDLGPLPCPACGATVEWGVVHHREFRCYPCSIAESDRRREALRP